MFFGWSEPSCSSLCPWRGNDGLQGLPTLLLPRSWARARHTCPSCSVATPSSPRDHREARFSLTGGEIDIRIIDSASATGSEWAVACLRNRKAVPLRTASVSTIPAKAANHEVYAIFQGVTERELAAA